MWSGKSISKKYDLDHAIPFSLWKNNDLWNLLPADSKVNGNKKDKLPTNELIKSRKDNIIHYWTLIQTEFPARFEYEANKLTGMQFYKTNWENKLFASFAEAVEITAIQRGVERWQPSNLAATGTEGKSQIVSEIQKNNIPSISLPYFPNLEVACGLFKDGAVYYQAETMDIENTHGNFDPDKHFIVRAVGDSMDGGNAPIKDGDLLLLELYTPVTAGSISSSRVPFAVEYQDKSGNLSYALKRINKEDGKYFLVSANKEYPAELIDPDKLFPFARLKQKI